MAGKKTIDELISEKAFQQADTLMSKLSDLNKEFDASIDRAKQFSDAVGGSKGLKDVNVNSAKAAAELEKLNKITLQAATAQQNLNKATAQAEAAQNRLATTTEKQARATAEQARQAEKRKRIVQESTAAEIAAAKQNAAGNAAITTTLNAQDIANGKAAASAAARSAQTKSAGRAAQVAAVQISEETAAIETNTAVQATGLAKIGGQLTKGLGYLRTLAYILPGIGIAGIFNLAFEAISQTSDRLGFFTSKINQARQDLDAFNDINKEANKQAGEQTTKLKYLYAAATDVANSMQKRLLAARELQKEFPNTFKNISDEKIALGEASGAYDTLTEAILKNARAKAAADKISALESKKLDADVEIIKTRTAEMGEQKRLVADIKAGKFDLSTTGEAGGGGILEGNQAETIHKNAVQRVKDLKALRDGYSATQRAIEAAVGGKTAIGNSLADQTDNTNKPKKDDNRKQVLDQQIKDAKLTQDTILQDEKSSLEDRFEAVLNYEIRVSALLENAKNTKIITALDENNRLKELDLDISKTRIDLLSKAEKELLTIFKDGAKALSDQEKADLEKRKQGIEDYGQSQLETIQDTAQKELIALEKSYAKGELTKSEYEATKLHIEYDANRASIEAQLSTAAQILDIHEKAGLDVSAQKKALSDLTRKLAKNDADYEIAQLKTVGEARKEQNEKIKELAEEVFNFGVAVVNAGYENEKNRIQERSDAISVQKDKDIAEVDRSLATEQQKADKIAVINAKAQAQQDVLDARKREIAVRQAKFEKAMSLARIFENTYAGASKALAEYPFPYSSIVAGLVIAIGAAQAAQVIATPIPKYAKGTDYHKGGAMIVGDAGQELVIHPDGKQYLTPDTDTLTSAPKGTKVITNPELVRMMASPEKVNYTGGQAVDISALVQAQKQTTKAIQAQKATATLITKRGWARQQQRVQDWSNYRNNHFN